MPKQVGADLVGTTGAATKAAANSKPVSVPVKVTPTLKTEEMVYAKVWGAGPDGAKPPKDKSYKLSSIPEITVLATWPNGSPRTIRYVQSVPYLDGADRWMFWDSYEMLWGCIPADLESHFTGGIEIDQAAMNIRGGVTHLINDVDKWSCAVNSNRQEGFASWGARTRIEYDAGRVLVPGRNFFAVAGEIEPYECYSLCCSRQPNLGTWLDFAYDLPDPATLPSPGPGGSGDPNASPDPSASPSDGSGSPGPGGSGDPNGSPSPGSSGDPNGGGDGDGTGGNPGSGSPSPSMEPSSTPTPQPPASPTATPGSPSPSSSVTPTPAPSWYPKPFQVANNPKEKGHMDGGGGPGLSGGGYNAAPGQGKPPGGPPPWEPPPNAPVGHRGKPIEIKPGTNPPATINGRYYTGHALDRMQERGITPSVVENAIATSPKTPSGNGYVYEIQGVIKVVTNKNGDVVTVMQK